MTSEKEKLELAKQWKIIDGSKLNANLPLITATDNTTATVTKNSNFPPKNLNMAPLLLSDDNLPKLAPARLEEKLKKDERRPVPPKRRDVTSKRRVVDDDCDESICSECQSMCGSQCTCSEASVKV